jgi:hypothetical protein
MKHILLVVILAITIVGVLYIRSTDGFENPSIDKTFFNNINNLFNPVLPQSITPNQMAQATQAIRTSTQSLLANSYDQGTGNYPAGPVQMGQIYQSSDALKKAQTICEVENVATDCSAFDKPAFAQYCGMSLDVGTNSTGANHTGGLYIDPQAKATIPSNGIYIPSYGTSDQFAVNKETCQFMLNDYKCKHGGSIGENNCTKCFTDGTNHAISPGQTIQNPSFGFYTNATELTLKVIETNRTYTLLSSTSTPTTGVSSKPITDKGNSYKQVTVSSVPLAEKQNFQIIAAAPVGTDVVLAGYIQADTQTGLYTIDINAVIDTDNEQSPNIGGNIKGYLQVNQLYGTATMNLKGMMPFTFLPTTSPDGYSCQSGPFITTKEGADFIDTNDACYGSNAKPGQYSQSCLRKLFLAAGGTTSGSGYPTNAGTMNTLLVDSTGTNRTLSDIADFLYDKSVLASTGLLKGQSVDIIMWNAASQYMTGRTITSPCDTVRPGTILSYDCLVDLFNKSGCIARAPPAKGRAYPDRDLSKNPPAIQQAQRAGDKTAALNYYTNLYTVSNDNSKSNNVRRDPQLDCYGVSF